jgi:hypothetical protein
MKSNTAYGIAVVLISLLFMLIYGTYWAGVYVVNKVLGVAVPSMPWFDFVLYALFWIGAGLFAVGIAMVIAGVFLDAVEMKAKYASLKKAKA